MNAEKYLTAYYWKQKKIKDFYEDANLPPFRLFKMSPRAFVELTYKSMDRAVTRSDVLDFMVKNIQWLFESVNIQIISTKGFRTNYKQFEN